MCNPADQPPVHHVRIGTQLSSITTVGSGNDAPRNTAQFEEKDQFPGGEDIPNAAAVREHFCIPKHELLELKEGVMWYRVFGHASNHQLPIILCSGGTGAAMFYKQFGKTLQQHYGGQVFIFDRFNMGLSDRLVERKNCMGLWTSQLLQMMDKLQIPRANLMGFSFAGTLVLDFAAQHPTRIGHLALISSQIGGAGPKLLKKTALMRKARQATSSSCFGDYIRQQTIVRYLKYKLPPAMYVRSEGQVEEGGDPDGLPVCKAMYRVKNHTHKLFEQLTDRTYFNGARSGCDDLCRQVAEAKIPVYARNYRDDGAEVNMKGFERVWALLRQGAPGASSYTVAPGAHHMFYSDSTAAEVAAFFGGGGRITKAVGITAAHSDLPSGKYMGCGWKKWQDEVHAAHSPSSRAALFLGIRR